MITVLADPKEVDFRSKEHLDHTVKWLRKRESQTDMFEQAYRACKIPISSFIQGAESVLRRYFSQCGLIVDWVTADGSAKHIIKLDRILNKTQLRNGIIRNDAEARVHFEGKRKSQQEIDSDLLEKYSVDGAINSDETIKSIRYGRR